MENIQIFNNPEFGDIRTVIIDGELWLVGRDVAVALGYAKPQNAVRDNVDKDDTRKQGIIDSIGREQKTVIINESGMYSLIFNSKLESAKRFKKWVTSEVLPSIHKTGGYGQQKTTQEQIILLAQGTSELYERVGAAEERITVLEDTMTIDYGQQRVLGEIVNKTVVTALGGQSAPAYKDIGRKVFAECNHDLKAYFKVNARANVPKKRFDEAVEYARNWKPCTNTAMLIAEYNAQQTLNLEGGASRC